MLIILYYHFWFSIICRICRRHQMTGLRDTTCRRRLRRLSGGCCVARRQDTTCRRQLSRLRRGCRVARPLGLGCHSSHRGLGGGRGHSISHRSEFLDLATFICISTAKLACAMWWLCTFDNCTCIWTFVNWTLIWIFVWLWWLCFMCLWWILPACDGYYLPVMNINCLGWILNACDEY
jgi:hypothetical protein